MTYIERIRSAGVVGCGGAGFPAHVKAASKVEYVIANGAECEPLLHKDLELMIKEPEAVVGGLIQWLVSTGSKKAIIGVKRKHEESFSGLKKAVENTNIEVQWLGDYYPTGDEYVLVYETTKRLIPPQGIPLDVGIVVNNVETLRNAYLASEGIPVTQKYISVVGAVNKPSTFLVPIGISFAEVIAAAGGATVSDFAVFISGIMMGTLTTDMSLPITKTCAGLVVLPMDHRLVKRKSLPETSMHRIGKSACDQCSYCTEFCPRYLLGYDVQPHKVMRSLGFTVTGEAIWNQYASLCCACGLCTLYACPEDLYPKEACDRAKSDLRAKGLKWEGKRDVKVHPLGEGRRTPLKQLIKKLGVDRYDGPAHFEDVKFSPKIVRIPLSQHIGSPASPVIKVGKEVKIGEVIGDIPDGKLGARIHASIDGVVTKIDSEVVIEKK
ncbi:MAG: 4Fe-4S dicluster domain-containing protein [Bacteroidota bacterium]|nr:4Fe-4S dicluster domain-containing protein [Bacteroidota bacterium]